MINTFLTLVLILFPMTLRAQTVTWTDGSGGRAQTEIRVNSDEPVKTFKVEAGKTTFSLVETVKAMNSPWFCVQARHVYPDGKASAWYISETEGICKLKSQFVTEQPPIVVVPPVEPPPVQPPLTTAQLAQIQTLIDTAVAKATTANNKKLADAIDTCLSKKQILKTCLTTMRDALRKP